MPNLPDKGYETVITDNFCNASKEVIQSLNELIGRASVMEEADVCDTKAMGKLFDRHEFLGQFAYYRIRPEFSVNCFPKEANPKHV